MRRLSTWVTVLALIVVFPSTAVAKRTLEKTVPREGATALKIENAVGDVSVSGSQDANVHVDVVLIPRKAGFFSSLETARRQVEDARLAVTRHGRTITLEIEGISEEPRFEASWTVTIPEDMALEVEMGVGDLTAEGITGDIEVDLGVGDANLATGAGHIKVDVGVGDIRLRAPASAYATVHCSTGVGEASLKHGAETQDGKGMISKDLSWEGTGQGSASLETGVGSIKVVLTER